MSPGVSRFGWYTGSSTLLIIFIVRLLVYFHIGVPSVLADVASLAVVFWAFAAVMVVGGYTHNFILLLIVFFAVLVIGFLIVAPIYGVNPLSPAPVSVIWGEAP